MMRSFRIPAEGGMTKNAFDDTVGQGRATGFARMTPCVTAPAEAEEGARMFSSIVDGNPRAVHIGMSGEVAFRMAAPQISIPVSRVAGSAMLGTEHDRHSPANFAGGHFAFSNRRGLPQINRWADLFGIGQIAANGCYCNPGGRQNRNARDGIRQCQCAGTRVLTLALTRAAAAGEGGSKAA